MSGQVVELVFVFCFKVLLFYAFECWGLVNSPGEINYFLIICN